MWYCTSGFSGGTVAAGYCGSDTVVAVTIHQIGRGRMGVL
jgi:hypothetical protein